MIAKPVVKNKFWIVENQGKKVATIQRCDQGVTWVGDNGRQKFESFDSLKNHYQVNISKWTQTKTTIDGHSVYKYPCDSFPYNNVWDIKHRVPLFTKSKKSRCYYAAGYYVMDKEIVFCPKYIFINRISFKGPYLTYHDAESYLNGTTITNNSQPK